MADDLSRLHGGIDPRELARLGLDREAILDLSVNVNPFGPHPDVAAAVAAASLSDYPDRHASAARRALADALDCDPERIALGHGSVELLWALIGVLAREAGSRPLLIIGPTFGEPLAAAQAHGLPVKHLEMREADGFAIDPRAIAAAIDAYTPCAVYLCQPNNPTGRALGLAELSALLQHRRDTCFLLDQAFLSLSTEHMQLSLRFEHQPHVVAIRSLTKDHALAGLRAGYVLADPALIRTLERQRPPWMASALTQAAVVAAVRHPEHVARAREALLDSRRQLTAALIDLGLAIVPTATHFCLVRIPDADAIRERLLVRHRILVRSCRSFGLPAYLRIAAGDATARARVVAALAQELS